MLRIIVNKIIPFGSFVAISIGPWVFVRDIQRVTTTLITHEEIHLEQQKELMPFGVLLSVGLAFVIGWWSLILLPLFYTLHGCFFIVELVRCLLNKSRGTRADGRHRSIWKRAYRCIPFEREAYAMEHFQGYIGARKHFAWLCVSVLK